MFLRKAAGGDVGCCPSLRRPFPCVKMPSDTFALKQGGASVEELKSNFPVSKLRNVYPTIDARLTLKNLPLERIGMYNTFIFVCMYSGFSTKQ